MLDRVTWLLPVKNGMPYLPETLASIESQTYQNWEILAWDNGSTDGSIEELQKWIPNRLPGRLVTGNPLPLGECLAEMVRQANTELCARIDADDVNFPNRLEAQISYLRNKPDIVVLGSQVNCIDCYGKNYPLNLDKPIHHDDIVNLMLRICPISHPSVLFRRSAILAVGNYRDVFLDGEREPIEDYDLWLRVAAHYEIANLDFPLVHYRIHDGNTGNVWNNIAGKAADNCLCRNAPQLYGCSEEDMRLLREWRHPNSVQVLTQIAEFLDKTQKNKIKNRLKMQSYIQVGRQMMSSRDFIACLRWANFNHKKSALLEEVLRIFRSGLRHISI